MMDADRTRSLTDMLSGLDWTEAGRGISYREGRARSLFNDTAFQLLQSALGTLASRGDEDLLAALAEEAASAILLDRQCSEADRRHVVLRFMDLFRALPRSPTEAGAAPRATSNRLNSPS